MWTPLTKLGRLVKAGKITQLEEVYTHSIPIKEAPIVDRLVKNSKAELSDEIMCILSVQKQTKPGQRTRFKAVVATGDSAGHVGIGIKVGKEVQIAIKGALLDAKINLIPVRRGYWGSKIGAVHTIPIKVKGKCGSCTVRMIPAPRGTGRVAALVSKKILAFAGVDDVYTTCTGQTRTRENFARAVFQCLKKSYAYLTPDLWPKTEFIPSPFIKYQKFLSEESKMRGPREGDRGRGRGRGGRGGDRGRGGRGGDRGRGGERGRGGGFRSRGDGPRTQ
jgi:small subunit ribosomal protein S2e